MWTSIRFCSDLGLADRNLNSGLHAEKTSRYWLLGPRYYISTVVVAPTQRAQYQDATHSKSHYCSQGSHQHESRIEV